MGVFLNLCTVLYSKLPNSFHSSDYVIPTICEVSALRNGGWEGSVLGGADDWVFDIIFIGGYKQEVRTCGKEAAIAEKDQIMEQIATYWLAKEKEEITCHRCLVRSSERRTLHMRASFRVCLKLYSATNVDLPLLEREGVIPDTVLEARGVLPTCPRKREEE